MPRGIKVGGRKAIVTALYANSILRSQPELDRLIAVAHPSGIVYLSPARAKKQPRFPLFTCLIQGNCDSGRISTG